MVGCVAMGRCLYKAAVIFQSGIIIINKQAMKLMQVALSALVLSVALSQTVTATQGSYTQGSYQSATPYIPTPVYPTPSYPTPTPVYPTPTPSYPTQPTTPVYPGQPTTPVYPTQPTTPVYPGQPSPYPSNTLPVGGINPTLNNIITGSSTQQGYLPTTSKKGLTMKASQWPIASNNYAMRMSCINCNPFTGDIVCSNTLPLLCIVGAKSLDRPYYNIAVQQYPFAISDGGYYDGWTGGVFAMTQGVQGIQLTSYQVGNSICQGYFGQNAKWAEFNDGHYMPNMNQMPYKAWGTWDWSQASRGGYNMWGYARTPYYGNAWVYNRANKQANCGAN